MEQQEIWKDIIGYEQYYEISNFSRIRTKPREVPCPLTGRTMMKRIRFLIQTLDNGYRRVKLYDRDSKKKTMRVHRLVAIHFIPNPENKPHINHKNGIRDDNRLENLEWCTNQENSQHAHDTGLQISKVGGDHHHSAKLTNEQASTIRELYNNNVPVTDIVSRYNVGTTTVYKIIHNQAYFTI